MNRYIEDIRELLRSYVFLWERHIILKLQPNKPGKMEKIIFYRSNFISKIGSLELVFGKLHFWSQRDMRPASRGTNTKYSYREQQCSRGKKTKIVSSSNKEAKWCVFAMFVISLFYLMVFAIGLHVFCALQWLQPLDIATIVCTGIHVFLTLFRPFNGGEWTAWTEGARGTNHKSVSSVQCATMANQYSKWEKETGKMPNTTTTLQIT